MTTKEQKRSQKKLSNFDNRYCRLIPEGDSIFNDNCRMCRLFSGHKGEHVFGLLYDN